MTIAKFKIEHLIIAVLVVIVLFKSCQTSKSDCDTEKVTITDKVVTEVDSFRNNHIKNKIPQRVSVIEGLNTIQVVPDNSKGQELAAGKPAYRYQDTTRVKNAVIYSDIISEGRILRMDLKTSIDHLERTIETTKTKTNFSNGLYLGSSMDYIPNLGISGTGLSIMYVTKDIAIGSSAFYQFQTNSVGFRLTVLKKIF